VFRSRLMVFTIASVLALCAVATFSPADVDPQIAEIIEGIKARADKQVTVYADQDVEIKVNGQVQEKHVQQIWVRDLNNLRIERADGTVILRTPEEVLIYEGRSKIMLHMPKETIEALGDKAEEAIAATGLKGPDEALDPFIKGAEHMSVVGDVFISDAECWVIHVEEEAFPLFRESIKDIPAEFEIEWLQMSIDKELMAARAVRISMTGPAALEINSMTWTIEEGVEIEDELLQFKPPADATIVVWTPDDDPEGIMERYRTAVRNEIIRQMQQQQ
jgi:outer membrane lipoprotein-sorting protein